MIQKTTGIVLRTQVYGETSLIVRIYTALYGMQSYLLKGVRGKKSKTLAGLFQVPNILEMEVTHREGDRLQSMREARILEPLNALRSDMIKSSVALFIAELVFKSLREEEPNNHAFEFLQTALLQLDAAEEKVANFHLAFMLNLTKVLGFYPNIDASSASILNLEEGSFTYQSANNVLNVLPPLTDIWRRLQETELHKCNTIAMNASTRRQLLEHLQNYYLLHLPGYTRLKSPAIFTTIFS